MWPGEDIRPGEDEMLGEEEEVVQFLKGRGMVESFLFVVSCDGFDLFSGLFFWMGGMVE